MAKKTQAMRLLEGKKITFDVYNYPETERDAGKIAATIGADSGEVFKTLVVMPTEGKPMLVMVPADCQLNLKKLAKETGVKKVKMASHAEAESLTGLQVGGISALALLHRGFAIYLDRRAEAIDKIFVSAGEKGLQIQLNVNDLKALTGAHYVDAVD